MSLSRCFSFAALGRKAASDRRRSMRCPAGVAALLVLFATAASAQPPLASNEIAAPEKAGVTLYQVNGFTGTVPMQLVPLGGPEGQHQLEFANAKMNTQVQFMAKAVAPAGTVFKSFNVSTVNGNHQIEPASADYFDDTKIIDKISISPWNLNSVLDQCRKQLTNADGTFKETVTFDLAVGASVVHGKAVFASAADPGDPAKWQSRFANVNPKTRVTAYIVKPTGAPPAPTRPGGFGSAPADGRVLPPTVPPVRRPAIQLPSQETFPGAGPRVPIQGGRVLPGLPQRVVPAIPSAGRRRPDGQGGESGAKPQFQRTKPHANPALETRDPQRPLPRLQTVRQRPS